MNCFKSLSLSRRHFVKRGLAILSIIAIFLTTVFMNCAPTGPTTGDDGTTTNGTTTTSIVTGTSIIDEGGTTSIVVVTSIVYDTTTTTNPVSTTTNPTSTTIPVSVVDMNLLPGRYTVGIPNSLKIQETPIAYTDSLKRSKSKIFARSLTRAEETSSKSFGYEMLSMTAQWIVENNRAIAKYFVVIDLALNETSATPATSYCEPYDITITDEIVNKIKAFAPDFDPNDWMCGWFDYESGVTQEHLPHYIYVGKADFGNVLVDPTIKVEGYDYMVLLNYYKTYSEYGMEDAFYTYFFWTEDKKSVKVIYDWASGDSPFRMEMSYDANTNISGMVYTSEDYPYIYDESTGEVYQSTFGEKEKSIYAMMMQGKTETNNSVMIKSVDYEVSSAAIKEFVIDGYIDDNGGYCETSSSKTDLTKTNLSVYEKAETYKYREQFDQNGYSTGWQTFDDEIDFYDETDTIGWEDVYGAPTWENTTYDDSYSENSETFYQDLAATPVNESINDNLPSTRHSIDVKLPANIEWDETADEVKKTFAITNDGQIPKSDGSNVIGYQTVIKDELTSNPSKPITFVMDNVDRTVVQEQTNMQLYEVDYNKVEVGSVETSTIVKVAVKGVVAVAKSVTGLFESSATTISKNVPGITPAKISVPSPTSLDWTTNPNAKKLLVLTKDGNAPAADGSNVVGMKQINQMEAEDPSGVAMPLETGGSGSNNYTAFVYDTDAPTAAGATPIGDPASPVVTAPVNDNDGDGDFDDENDDDDEEDEEDPNLVAPKDLVASTDRADGVVLTWGVSDAMTQEDDDNIDGFKIYTGSGFSPMTDTYLGKTSVGVMTFKDEKIPAGETRTYVVRCYSGEVLGYANKLSDPVTASGTRTSAPKPPAPTAVSASDGNDKTGIVITWSHSDDTDIESYEIYRKVEGSSEEFVHIDTVTDTDGASESYKDVGIAVKQRYLYKIVAKDEEDNINSDFSAYDSGEMLKFDTPTGLVVSTTYTDRIDLSWDVVSGADFYNIYRRPKGNLKWDNQITFGLKGTKYTDRNVEAYDSAAPTPISYEYSVTSGTSRPGNESDFTVGVEGRKLSATGAKTIPQLTYTALAGDDVNVALKWEPIKGGTVMSVSVMQSTDDGASWLGYDNVNYKDVLTAKVPRHSTGKMQYYLKIIFSDITMQTNEVILDPPVSRLKSVTVTKIERYNGTTDNNFEIYWTVLPKVDSAIFYGVKAVVWYYSDSSGCWKEATRQDADYSQDYSKIKTDAYYDKDCRFILKTVYIYKDGTEEVAPGELSFTVPRADKSESISIPF